MPAYLSRMLKGFERGGLVRRAAVARRRPQEPGLAHRQGPPHARHAAGAVAGRGGGAAGAAAAGRAAAAARRRCRRSSRCSAAPSPAGRAVPAAAPPARRHGLGGGAARPLLRRRVRLGHELRGARRRHRPALHRTLRPGPRALLDRRARRRDRRVGVPGEEVGDRRQAAAPGGRPRRRAASASAGVWSTSARGSPARPATGRSRCGPTASSTRRGTPTRVPATGWCTAARRSSASAKTLVFETWELTL